jgi:hypothetical protein
VFKRCEKKAGLKLRQYVKSGRWIEIFFDEQQRGDLNPPFVNLGMGKLIFKDDGAV